MTDLPDVVFSTPEMSAIFCGQSRVQRMLDFEAALARAEARAGIVPADAAAAIADRCDAAAFDLDALFESTSITGTLAVPLVQALTELLDDGAKGFVHWGATSQDAIDTGAVLQMRDGLDAIIDDLLHTGRSCLDVAESHRHTPMVGRTLLQHALPITLGLKAAHWLSAITRRIERLRQLRGELVMQFGGAAGTLAALGDDGVRVAEFLAEELNLELPDMPWHTDRDRIGDIAAALAVVAGTAGKIAHDITLLKQTEVHEANISGEGVSSAMPHKRNPVKGTLAAASVELALGATHTVVSAMVQEH
ncbi:MAG: lyase family protein, partial [Actinomycetota bacterium]